MGYQEILGKHFLHTKMKYMSQTSFVEICYWQIAVRDFFQPCTSLPVTKS